MAICWRGDGRYVATLVQHAAAQQLPGPASGASEAAVTIKMWEPDGCVLHAVGERATGLLPVGAWQPNGRHLYVAQHTTGGPRVVLFETNGLQHGGFSVADAGDMRWQPPASPLSKQHSAPA